VVKYKKGVIKMKNKVIAGDYVNMGIIFSGQYVQIVTGFMKTISLNKETVERYEIITEEHRKSGTSAILRGSVGAAVLGPVGILAGVSAKNKGTYQIAIEFKDGKKSLIEIEDKAYKLFMKTNF
jgi:hypothetical protein